MLFANTRLTAKFRLSALYAAALLAGCGGGGGNETAAPVTPAPTPTTLSGSVAVGAPMTDGKLRVLDANGAVVVANVAIAADGSYPAVTLSGPAPWRLEACGYTGANYQCLYSVAQAAGTANVTPLTNAMLLLASGQAPETLMTGAATGLNASTLAGAQTTLRTGLASVLADAGVGSTLDLVSGSLSAGSRLQLEGLEGLFRNMTSAIRTAATCSAPNTGLAASLSSNASFASDEGDPLSGPGAVAQGLCTFLAGGDGEPSRLGSRFLSPTLGRCDFSATAPVCGVSFVLQGTDGSVEQVGQGMGVTFEAGAWKFKGDLLPISIQASARVQRDRRIDGSQVVDTYARALAFDIPALSGLACAKVAQRAADGSPVTLAYFKPHAGNDLRRLSAWRASNDGASRSLDPTVGATRSTDDTWLALPQGDAGDAAVRNFFRGGRSVTVSLYSNGDCSTPFTVAGRSSFEVDVEGVPPVWASLPSLPWPSLSDASVATLRSLVVAASSSFNYSVSWGFARGSVGVNGLTFCSDRADCGQGNPGRLGEAGLRAAATSGSVTLHTGTQALEARGYKMLSIYGRTADGAGMQSNHMSCPSVTAGLACEN